MKAKFRASTIEKLGEALIQLGQAAIIGGGATLFVEGVIRWSASLSGIRGGIVLALVGLYIHNKASKFGE
jgi:hypothetical protein